MTAWISAVAEGAHSNVSDEALGDLFDGVWVLLEGNRLDVLDDILQEAPFEKMPNIAIVGLLRYSFEGRSMLPSWPDTVKRAMAVIEDRSGPATLLDGLA